MKLKLALIAIIVSIGFISCDDDDDPKYNWQSKYIVNYKNVDDQNIFKSITLIDDDISETDANIQSILRNPLSTLIPDSSRVVDDEMNLAGNYKSRIITYMTPIANLKTDSFLYEINISFLKID
ncbi:hypothetical protein D0T53_13290 [Dysgonomonas sp. 216]|uniref:hypothetical protein n=1 Tax=Dysgonomonas sp. 216 TaxID=2302934 RepID=UPI0013D47D89|nr:hypothetical protein [Dysgonomonas sp. 216]NDW19873.1 hypothetical protein [Dysgonomonas sp. 216]